MILPLLALLAGTAFIFALIVFVQRRTSSIDRAYFAKTWPKIEALASKKATWVQAVVDADKLLDEALKQSNINGTTVAERMVEANRVFSDANMIWSSHKLRNKVVHESKFVLKKKHVQAAMSGYKQALKDLGAL